MERLVLFLDLTQYFLGGLLWKRFYDINCKAYPDNDPDLKAPDKISKPLYVIYYFKIGFMLLSYVLIIIFLFKNLRFK